MLEFEVVTTAGQHLVASPKYNADLYWALSGGGAGNYAVVVSMTLKVHQDNRVAGASSSFVNRNADTFWAGVTAWTKHLLVLATIPNMSTQWAVNNEEFLLESATFSDGNVSEMNAALRPFIQDLTALNISLVAHDTRTHQNSKMHYEYWATQTYNTNNSLGGRLIQRSAVENNLPAVVNVFRGIVNSTSLPGALISGVANNVTHERVGIIAASNSVLPAWRESLFTMNIGIILAEDASWNVQQDVQVQLNEWQDQLRAITRGGGAYIDEATFDNPNWKTDYFGINYDRIQDIKTKYDPEGLLWSNAAVGSDQWTVAPDGRLCRA